MDVLKLAFIIKFPADWKEKFFQWQISNRNINLWEELEQPMKPGESFKDYRQRLDDIARKVHQLRNKIRED